MVGSAPTAPSVGRHVAGTPPGAKQPAKGAAAPPASHAAAKSPSEGATSVWGRPRPGAAAASSSAAVLPPAASRTGAGSSQQHSSGGQSPSKAKTASSAVSASKTSSTAPRAMNIAAQAARNLGGFVPNKIFIGGVPITCSEEQFRNYFKPFGPISKVELHALRGFGYITYESVESVDACLEKYEDHYLSKKWVEVKRSIPRELIDAYEREQRRLHAEAAAESGEKQSAPVDSHAKVEHSLPPPAATSAWGGGGGHPGPSTQRRGPPTAHGSR